MKESLIYDGKKFLNNLFENLVFERTVSAPEVKKLLKVFAIETGSLMYFSSLVISEGVIETKLSTPFQVLFISFHVFIKYVCEIVFFMPFEECRWKISIVFVIAVMKFSQNFVFTLNKV